MILKAIYFIISTFLLISLLSCDKSAKITANIGLSNSPQISIYLADSISAVKTSYSATDFTVVEHKSAPLIRYQDILFYDTTNHILAIRLTKQALIDSIGGAGVIGPPFAVLLDSTVIYGGFFWSSFSSIPCRANVIDILNLVTLGDTLLIQIERGYPTSQYASGPDIRNEPVLVNLFSQDSKLKSSFLPYPCRWHFDSIAYGCGDFLAYSYADSFKVALVISATVMSLSLSTQPREYDLSVENKDLRISISVYDKDASEHFPCNTTSNSPNVATLETWKAISGSAFIATSINPPFPFNGTKYCADISLDSLVLKNESNYATIIVPPIHLANVTVGQARY